MNCYINKLPSDIISIIIPYTYNLQNKQLLDDIINYKETKKKLFELYYKFWIIDIQSEDPEEDKNWLINDIFGYANDHQAIMNGYVNKFYTIFKRNNCLQSIQQIDKYVSNLIQKDVITQINIFLGLLSINERKDLVDFALELNV
jgi:hypothetical protein